MTTGRINQVSIVGTLATPGDGGAQPQPLSRADAFVFTHARGRIRPMERGLLFFAVGACASLHALPRRSR